MLATRKTLHNVIVDTMTYTYDALQRLTSQTIQRSTGLTLAKEYSYKNLSGGRTTQQISSYTAKVNGTAVDSYSYTYDSLGNITAINRNGYAPLSYTYDYGDSGWIDRLWMQRAL